jgi:hypothetical protein
MSVFEHGHFDGFTNGGWVIGHFGTGGLKTDDVEVKWAHHEPGPAGKGWSNCETSTTLSVLISGQFNIEFRESVDAPPTAVHLKEQGDYVLFGPGIQHQSTALQPSVFLTVRWPSLKGDCASIR